MWLYRMHYSQLYHCATYSQKEKFPKSHDPNGLIERTLAEMLPYSIDTFCILMHSEQ